MNVKDEDHERFKYCVLYHQSEKGEHSDIITVPIQVLGNPNWDGVHFPTSFDDVTKFENNNQVCVNKFVHSAEQYISPIGLGHIKTFSNDNVNLVLIKDERDDGHYLQAKKIES